MIHTLKRFIPPFIKEEIKQIHRTFLMDRAMNRITALKGASVPGANLITDLLKGWDNDGYAADLDYLQAVCLAVTQTKGPILECGSGASTVLLNLLAAPRGIPVWSLEHFPEWHSLIRAKLHGFGLREAKVTLTPLRNYGSFSWYDFPSDGIPQDFRLVICDGPPGSTPGGRYGLLPIAGKYLAKDVLVYLDDANRPDEKEALQRWKTEYGIAIDIRPSSGKSFAIVSQPS